MTGRYATEELAERRVAKLKTFGIWPGKRQHTERCPCRDCPRDGSWDLLYDPDVEAQEARHDLMPEVRAAPKRRVPEMQLALDEDPPPRDEDKKDLAGGE